MDIERRKTSAQSLRQLFQNQWVFLNGLLEHRLDQRRAAKQRDLAEQGAVGVVVEGTDTLLRLASGYRRRLRSSARGLLEHVDRLVADLPAPIDVRPKRFLHDPRVNAFFVNVDAIRDTFSQSHDLQSFFADPLFNSRSHAFALMFMQKVEKEVFGPAMVNGILRHDVRKTAVSFTDHRILQPRESEAQAREALERLLFENVVEFVNRRLSRLGSGEADEDKLCAGLNHPATGKASKPRDPEAYLHCLCRILDAHRELLRLETPIIRVNRIGEIVTADSKQVANDVELNEIHLGHDTHEVLALVRYPREEMISRDELLRRASARLQY